MLSASAQLTTLPTTLISGYLITKNLIQLKNTDKNCLLMELQEGCSYCLENTYGQQMTIKVFQITPIQLIYYLPDTLKPRWLVTQPRLSVSLLPWELLSEKGKHNTTKITKYPLAYINNHFYPSVIKLKKASCPTYKPVENFFRFPHLQYSGGRW